MINTTYTVPCMAGQTYSNAPAAVSVPGSKSITNRALLLATLAEGESVLSGALFSEDSRHFLSCIQALGFDAHGEEAAGTITVTGRGGSPAKNEASIYVGSAGTAARFLSAYLGVCKGTYHLDASEQMRKRPMAALLHCLEELGCDITYEGNPGCFPFTVKGHGFQKQEVCININESSQFLSALLICACLSTQDFTVRTTGTHGMSYIAMTVKMMEQFGVHTECPAPDTFFMKAGQHYHARSYEIEPDVSAAAYFYAAGPLLQVPVQVNGVHFDSLQGDIGFLRILERMGCHAKDTREGILLSPPGDGILHGVTVDMSACSDQAITLAALAPFADSPTVITGIGHIRRQESDRIAGIAAELTKMGIVCEEAEDGITVYPGTPKACVVNTYEDHRMAMGFSLIGLKVPGIVIDNPACCRKTFENYFETLERFLEEILYTKNGKNAILCLHDYGNGKGKD